MGVSQRLTRIGIFYDGNYFGHVSGYYGRSHPRQARIRIGGLHDFIRHRVAFEEAEDARFCQIVDVHYFRGRLRAQDAEERSLLRSERSFDDVLMREGVTTHYLPLGSQGEKGIDVWLALEAFELAIYKRFDVLALVAGDGDFVPLVRKLNSLGTRVMLLGWDFQTKDPTTGQVRETRTSHALLKEVTYPLLMHDLIDDPEQPEDLISGIFLPSESAPQRVTGPATEEGLGADPLPPVSLRAQGTILTLKEGFGFIRTAISGSGLYFSYNELAGPASALRVGSSVGYELGTNREGSCAVKVCIEPVQPQSSNLE